MWASARMGGRSASASAAVVRASAHMHMGGRRASESSCHMGETLIDLPAGLVSGPFFARIFFMYETVRMQKSGVTQGR